LEIKSYLYTINSFASFFVENKKFKHSIFRVIARKRAGRASGLILISDSWLVFRAVPALLVRSSKQLHSCRVIKRLAGS